MSSLSIFNNLEILRHHAYIQRENFQTVLQRIYEVNLQRVQRIQRIFCTTAFLVQIILFSSVTSIFFYLFFFFYIFNLYINNHSLSFYSSLPALLGIKSSKGLASLVQPFGRLQRKRQTSTNVRPVQMSDQYKRQTSANIGPV